MSGLAQSIHAAPAGAGTVSRLNREWHEKALWAFMAIVIAHWTEHILQAIQIWWLHWERPAAKGALGYVWPWLVTSEWLHYAYAIVMLAGLIILRCWYRGPSCT
jgi:hypothetical protein